MIVDIVHGLIGNWKKSWWSVIRGGSPRTHTEVLTLGSLRLVVVNSLPKGKSGREIKKEENKTWPMVPVNGRQTRHVTHRYSYDTSHRTYSDLLDTRIHIQMIAVNMYPVAVLT